MLQEKAKEVEEADAGAAAARACGAMYKQVNRGLWAASQDTCLSSLSSATPLFSDLELTPDGWVDVRGPGRPAPAHLDRAHPTAGARLHCTASLAPLQLGQA